MDQNRNSKRPHRRPISIDGIVTDGRELGVPSNHSYRPSRGQPTPNLGDFVGRTDGFQPTRQSPHSLGGSAEAAETEALLDEPIILDDADDGKTKKDRYFRRLSLRRKLKKTAAVLSSLVLILGTYLGVKFYVTEKHLFRGGGKAPALAENLDINQLKGEGDGRVNILLLGNGGPEHRDGPDLTDTIIIVSIDPINNKAALLSVPRDLWVKIPSDGSRKINEAYYYGKLSGKSKKESDKKAIGVNWVDQTLEPILGIPIHYHAVVDFAAFRQTVDAVGGVDANVSKDLAVTDTLWDESTGKNYYLNVKPGQQHFDGRRALFYARSRQTSVRGDFDRAQRQRQIIVSLKDKILSAGTFSNPVKISQLLDSLGNNVYTDFNSGDFRRLYKVMSKISSPNISSVDLVTPPHNLLTTANLNGVSIVEPRAGLSDYDEIRSYVRNTLKDSFIAKENSSIAVYNATDVVGLAASKADFLKSYGYNITTIANAPSATNPAKTTLIDLTKGTNKVTRHYLEGRFGVVAQNSLPPTLGVIPPAGTNFVIILGKDAADSR